MVPIVNPTLSFHGGKPPNSRPRCARDTITVLQYIITAEEYICTAEDVARGRYLERSEAGGLGEFLVNYRSINISCLRWQFCTCYDVSWIASWKEHPDGIFSVLESLRTLPFRSFQTYLSSWNSWLREVFDSKFMSSSDCLSKHAWRSAHK